MTDRDRLELLAPAGSFEALKAAVANGADAVYLGGERFNARQGAGNFSDEALRAALNYAKERDVKVYVTLNTLVKDDEMNEALQFAGFVYEEGADAVIVQDIGLTGQLRRFLPGLKLHASTQMTIMNSHGLKFCEEMGIKRVVPARELSLREIRTITGSSPVEVEIFIHGALCVSYSGQCLLSSFIGGRSGNRGSCAQPCRLPWSISRDEEKWSDESYLLSTRDLMGIPALPAIKRIGVSSLKIEGRMKSPEYVAVVTGVYRKYIDRLELLGEAGYRVDGDDLQKLMQVFNRGGFTASFLEGSRDYSQLVYPKHPKNRGVRLGTVTDSRRDAVKVLLEKPLHMGDGIEVWDIGKGVPDIIVSSILLEGKHERYAPAQSSPWIGDMKTGVEKGSEVWRTYSKPLMLAARESFEHGEKRLVSLEAAFSIRVGSPAVLNLTDKDGNSVSMSTGEPAQKALTRALSEERITEQLKKTGDTPYRIDSVSVESDGLSTLPISSLNALRRDALEEIRRIKISRGKRENTDIRYEPRTCSLNKNTSSLTAFFYGKPRMIGCLNELTRRIYVPVTGRKEAEEIRKAYPGEIYVWTPNIIKDEETASLIEDLSILEGVIDGVSAANPGTLNIIRRLFPSFKLHADSPLNLFNSASLDTAAEWGSVSATLSPELRDSEASRLEVASLQTEAIVYGHIPLMTLEACPAGAISTCGGNCGACRNNRGYLKDRKGIVFPYIRGDRFKRTMLMSPVPIFTDLRGNIGDSGVSLFRLCFSDEDDSAVKVVLKWFNAAMKGIDPLMDKDELKIFNGIKAKGGKGSWTKGV